MDASAYAEDIEVPDYDEDIDEAFTGPGILTEEFYDDEYEEESVALIEGAASLSHPELIASGSANTHESATRAMSYDRVSLTSQICSLSSRTR